MKIDTQKLYHWLWVIYVASRVINILGLPMYLDEGIYISWADLAREDGSYAYIPLMDGKTPLHMWTVAWLRNVGIPNYLLIARLVGVAGGLLTLVAWTKIAQKYFGDRVAKLFGVIFLVMPYGMFIERLGLVDSMTTGLTSLALYWLLGRNMLLSVTSGIAWGLAYWTKTSSKVLLGLGMFLTAVTCHKQLVKSVIAALIVLVVYREMTIAIRTGGYKFWTGVATKEAQLTFTPNEIWDQITRGDGIIKRNVLITRDYFLVYLGAVLFLATFGLGRKSWWLGAYVVVFTVGITLAARIPASRYLYPIVPPIAVLAAVGWSKRWRLGMVVVVILGLQSLVHIVAPMRAWYAPDDRAYFVESELSALGLGQVADFMLKNPGKLGVSGIWGVADGSLAILNDAGIPSVSINGWSGDLGRLDSVDYAYLTGKGEDLALMRTRYKVEVFKEFVRPGSGGKVYLVRVYDEANK